MEGNQNTDYREEFRQEASDQATFSESGKDDYDGDEYDPLNPIINKRQWSDSASASTGNPPSQNIPIQTLTDHLPKKSSGSTSISSLFDQFTSGSASRTP
jgi:hypothetical protein